MPTEKERKAAAASINDAFDRADSLAEALLPSESDRALRLRA
jgi:hypothetical protein